MKLTAIKQQLKQTGRYSLYVDGSYSFSLSESALLASSLASGQELSREQLEQLKKQSVDDKFYNRALHYVALRPRSVWEIESYLTRKESAPDAVQQVVDRLRELGLLNDTEFAASYIRTRQLLRPTSRRLLQLELTKKHLAKEVIDTALAAADLDEADSLQTVITKKRRQSKYQDDTKLMQYLARQGFSYGAIKAALQVEAA